METPPTGLASGLPTSCAVYFDAAKEEMQHEAKGARAALSQRVRLTTGWQAKKRGMMAESDNPELRTVLGAVGRAADNSGLLVR